MNPIVLFIESTPVAQPRHKQACRGKDRKTGRWIITNYIPAEHKVHAWRKLIEVELKLIWRELELPLIDEPIAVDLTFVFPLPKSKRRKVNHRKWLGSKPDRDNLDKAVLDALSGICWTDDAKVCFGELAKYLAGDGDKTGVVIRIREPGEPTGWADEFFHVGAKTETLF